MAEKKDKEPEILQESAESDMLGIVYIYNSRGSLCNVWFCSPF